MRGSKWVFVLLLSISAGVGAQQAAAPTPGQMKNPPATQDKAPQLSEKDQGLACPAGTGTNPAAEGVYKVGGGVKPPRPTNQVEAEFSDEARKMAKKMKLKNFYAVSLVTLIVDAEGNQRIVCVVRPAGYGLDGQAVRAAEQYRFEPATKDGTPVATRISVEVNFRLY